MDALGIIDAPKLEKSYTGSKREKRISKLNYLNIKKAIELWSLP